MIDLIAENVLPLTEAAKQLPRRREGKGVHVATLYRWAGAGTRGVKLETLRVGGVLCTSLEALQRFCNKLTDPDAPVAEPTRTRKREIEQADRELEAAGI